MNGIILLVTTLTLSLPAATQPSSSTTPAERPNIIFLLTDDQRDNTLGAMGHPFVKTPNLDRLMQDSVRFRNAYIAEPVCAPSRVSFFTGMHERVHGVGFTSSYQLTEAQWDRSYPALLRKAGYHTGFIGKFGVEYYTFKGRAAEKFDFWWAHDGWTKFLPKGNKSPSCVPYHQAQEDIITFIMGEAMTKFLDGLPSDKPFCLSVSFNVPHGSQTTSMYPDYPEWNRMTRPANENPQAPRQPVLRHAVPGHRHPPARRHRHRSVPIHSAVHPGPGQRTPHPDLRLRLRPSKPAWSITSVITRRLPDWTTWSANCSKNSPDGALRTTRSSSTAATMAC